MTMGAEARPVGNNWGIEQFVREAVEREFIFEAPVLDESSGNSVLSAGKEMVNLAGCSFLGMNTRPDIRERFASAAERYGPVTGGSRLLQGVTRPFAELEAETCRLTGKERCLSFATGTLANLGFVHAMSRPVKLEKSLEIDFSDSVFVMDMDSHWSLWKAVEGLERGERLFLFRHNDPESLEKVLAPLAGRKIVVIFESVYSADGSIAPIGDILDVCERHGALSYCDDANGFLVYGEENRPFHEEFKALDRATFRMVSYAKSVGLEGGGIAGPKEFIQAFEWFSGTSVFTSTMLPPAASAATMAMRLLDENPGIVDEYLERCGDFRRQLLDIGCTLNPTPSYIVTVSIGDDDKAVALRREFAEAGYLVPIFRFPAVKRNRAGMRLMMSLDHTEADIKGFVAKVAELKRAHAF